MVRYNWITLGLLIVFHLMGIRAGSTHSAQSNQRVVEVNVLLEGLFCQHTYQLKQAHSFEMGDPIPILSEGLADTITIAFHNIDDYSVNVWGELIYYETKAILDVYGRSTIQIPDHIDADPFEGNYWLSIRHRNHVEIVFADPITIGEATYYTIDFITGSESDDPSVGSNQKYLGSIILNGMETHAYAMYAGDINGDGHVNLTDRGLLNHSIGQGLRGYLNSDLNGDGVVTISDRSLLHHNIFDQISRKTP